ncbi:hypothetical protein M433DRAFT_446383 [Acidomyces richmondensis BFW]|nr:MAG: hypothetical protein FE78DRAFT_230861 [Acidomyces sp. 'richmondensis']KYG48139.1 hypothetical protein M433DRAFT_446383 [Acidomyces richmondensis BFW]
MVYLVSSKVCSKWVCSFFLRDCLAHADFVACASTSGRAFSDAESDAKTNLLHSHLVIMAVNVTSFMCLVISAIRDMHRSSRCTHFTCQQQRRREQ